MRDLSEVKQNLKRRFASVEKKVAHYSLPELVQDKIERTIFSFLTELGIDFPIDFSTPPPDVEVFARQNTNCLDPAGTTIGSSPPIKTDRACYTWKARPGGFMVIDSLDWIMEDPIAEECFKLTFTFDEQDNDPRRQKKNSVPEPGHWKFNRMVLADEEVLTVCVINICPFAGGCYSLENRNWML